MKINVLIVDDEPLSCARIKRLLQTEEDIGSIEIAESGQAGIAAIRERNPDLLFLDIEMPDVNGFDLLHEIGGRGKPYTIFITAYEEHAIKAFEVDAVDYLLKPVGRERLRTALQRARKLIWQSASRAESPYRERLMIKDAEGLRLIKVAEIDWIEADGRYVVLHCGGSSYAIREGISSVSSRLNPARFVRIHRSYVVNVDRIQKLQPLFHGDYRVLLHDGTKLVLTRHYKDGIQKALGDHAL